MLESVRKHQKILQLILVILIFPSFAFFGISSYMGKSVSGTDVAVIDGQPITQVDVDNAVRNQAARLGVNQQDSQTPRFRSAVVGKLVQQRLIGFEMKSLRLQVSEDRLAKSILELPEIASLKNPDGSIDVAKYNQLLQSNGLTVPQFQNIRKSELMSSDLQEALGSQAGSIQSQKVSDKLIEGLGQEREVQAMFFTADDYLKGITLEEKDLQDYYQANSAKFLSSPRADVEYVLLKKNSNEDEKEFTKRADTFANTVYEQPDSLKPTADALHLEVSSFKGYQSNGASSLGAQHPLNQEKVLKAVFMDEVLKSGKNTDAIQVAPDTLVAVHVTKYMAPQTLPFEKVKDQIANAVKVKKAEEVAQKNGKEVADHLAKDPNADGKETMGKAFSKPLWVSRFKPMDLKGEPFERVFSASPMKLPQIVTADLPGVGVAIYRINQVRTSTDTNANLKIGLTNQIASLTNQNEFAAYFDNIRSRAKVKISKSGL